MPRTDTAPTKSNLLRAREQFGFVRSGHDLLNQKREVLLEELLDMHRDAAQLRSEAESELQEIYAAYRAALLAAGREVLEIEALGEVSAPLLELRERSVMGVIVPLVEIKGGETPEPGMAPSSSPPAAAEVRRRVRALLEKIGHLTEVEVSCRRAGAELQKTQRRVNALEHIFIPEYRDTIRFIEATLEEREREELFHLKRLKAAREESR